MTILAEALPRVAALALPRPGTLAVDRLCVRFQGLAAISDVSLALHRHEILGLIGPNGAGKTTLVNCLTGYQVPTSGRVLLGSRDVTGWRADRLRLAGIARTFQSGRLFKAMSVLDNVAVTAVGFGHSRRRADRTAMDLLAWVGLADMANAPAGTLAYTDQRRLGIARALVAAVDFLLLDEPAAGMSDAECEGLVALVAQLPQKFGCGVLLIEHNMHVVMAVSHRIHVLDGGRTIAEGPPADIQKHKAVLTAYLGLDA